MVSQQLGGYLALQELITGNKRFVEGRPRHPDQEEEDRDDIAERQRPSAVVLGCSDSRVPPTIVFDQGLGFIFEVRTAGHVIDNVVLGSIEYAVTHLRTQLVLVLGHTECGALDAALDGGSPQGHLSAVTGALQPIVKAVRGARGDPLSLAVKANVKWVRDRLRVKEPILSQLVHQGRLEIEGAIYDLDTGKVTLVK
jgi:carbonic anhydrase